ncbi:MAG: glycine betaine ABC transporter substrate-binding protein [Pseudomonadota bacterium]
MRVPNKLLATCAAALLATTGAAQAADVVIGVPNWPSVNVTAHILKVILEDNMGLEVELQNSTNPVVFEAMDRGSMHVHPEVWLPNQSNLHQTYVKDKASVVMNPNGVEAFQGFCVTKHTADTHGVKSIYDLTDPDKAALFDTDGDGKGEVWIGASGWASTNVEKIRAKTYGYDETMNLMEMDETLALANVDAAVAGKKPLVFFCYTPHHMFALHELVILEEPAHDSSNWNVIQPTDDPDWLAKSEAGSAWDLAHLHIHFAKALEESHPEAAAVLKNVQLDTDQVSAMTYALVVEKQDPAEYAKKWVDDNAELVAAWTTQ